MYDNPEICSACGGKCCKGNPGRMLPNDVFAISGCDNMKDALQYLEQTGDYKILSFYVRPTTKTTREFRACVFLGMHGCKLTPDKRPHECRHLEPKMNADSTTDCICHGESEADYVEKWLPYSKDLGEY